MYVCVNETLSKWVTLGTLGTLLWETRRLYYPCALWWKRNVVELLFSKYLDFSMKIHLRMTIVNSSTINNSTDMWDNGFQSQDNQRYKTVITERKEMPGSLSEDSFLPAVEWARTQAQHGSVTKLRTERSQLGLLKLLESVAQGDWRWGIIAEGGHKSWYEGPSWVHS